MNYTKDHESTIFLFYNRVQELSALNEHFAQPGAQLLIVYGRRRVGKTELLRRFALGKPHIYLLADLSSEKEELALFSERIQVFSGDAALRGNPFSQWAPLFAYLGNLAKRQRLVVVLDEYQYLQSSSPAISSILQAAWDTHLKETQLFLILCGSYISFMESELLSYKSPLYGRRTGQLYVEPLRFSQAALFFPDRSVEQRIVLYGILGGTPAYLLQFRSKRSLAHNILKNVLRRDAFLYDEPRFLLMQELKEPRNYFAILTAIALGASRINDIVQRSGLERGTVARYLDTLRNLRIVKREVSVHEDSPEKSRKGIYKIQDFFFRFWFRFVLPNRSYLEEEMQDFVLREKILPYLNEFTGPVFEEVCLETLKLKNARDELPFRFARAGRFWTDRVEIDVVAFDERREHYLLAECKWSNKPVGLPVLENLIRKSAAVPRLEGKKVYYVLFSRSGFTEPLKRRAGSSVLLFDLREVAGTCLGDSQHGS